MALMILGMWLLAIGLLIYAAWIDYTQGILPNGLIFTATGLLLVSQGLQGKLASAIGGALIAFSLFKLVQLGYRRIRGQDGLGSGDAKLMLALGAMTGCPGVAWTIGVGSLLALVCNLPRIMRRRGERCALVIPFGPYLVWAGLGCHLYMRDPRLWSLVWAEMMKELFYA